MAKTPARDVKTAIVVGAGSGIGRATAVLLGAAGYSLVLAGRRREKLEQTAGAIQREHPGAGGRPSPVGKVADILSRGERGPGAHPGVAVAPCDATDPEACKQLVGLAVEHFRGLDALVNVAGYAVLGPVDRNTPEEWRKTIDANLSYVVYLSTAAWPVFQRQHSGVIVNVSSMASVDPFEGFSMYAAAKTGLNMFTRCLGQEGARIGVRAVTIAPGAVETEMLRGLFDEKKVPAAKTLKPEQVAAVIRDCLTGARAFANGETIPFPSP